MNPKQTVPLALAAAPLLAAAPPLFIGAAIGLGLIWLFSSGKWEPIPEATANTPETAPSGTPTAAMPARSRRKVMLEDLAAVFEQGERSMTRGEAVAALQARGIGKTAAYAALAPGGKFAAWLDYGPDGVISWEG